MAAQILISISKDEIERARLNSEYKFAVDLQSKMVEAKMARKEGREKTLSAVIYGMLANKIELDIVMSVLYT